MQVHYLEIVTEAVEDTIAAMAAMHGVTFGDPDPALGNARIAQMTDGGRIAVRAPLAEHDQPIVRHYFRVDNIDAATAKAEAAGAQFAMKATPVPGQGKFAIYFLGGMQFGLWEL
ncbi:MAG: hydroxylase [Pseudomonadota bacterium]